MVGGLLCQLRLFAWFCSAEPGLGAFVGDVEITRESCFTVEEWIRRVGIFTARFHPCEGIAIDSGMAAQQGHSFLLLRNIERVLERSERSAIGCKPAARHKSD